MTSSLSITLTPAKLAKEKLDVGTSLSTLGLSLKEGMTAMAASLATWATSNNQVVFDIVAKNQEKLITAIHKQAKAQMKSIKQLGDNFALQKKAQTDSIL